MKIRALLLLLALIVAGAAVAQAQTRVSLGFFYDSLSPYGSWAVSAQYGNVWRPHVAAGWRPYVYGHWVNSDFGWTWLSDENWGWATYHYGRWYWDPVFGWCWVPGYDWAPAWVDWQWGDGWIGWAPLPPAFAWTGFDVDFAGPIAPQAFVFVQDRFFLDPHVGFRAIDPVRNAAILRTTRNVTRFANVNGTVAVRSLPVDQIQRVTGRAVPRYQVVSTATRVNPRVEGNRLLVYRPAVSHVAATRRPAASHAMSVRPPATTPMMRQAPQRHSPPATVVHARSSGHMSAPAPATRVAYSRPAPSHRAVAQAQRVRPTVSHARTVVREPASARARVTTPPRIAYANRGVSHTPAAAHAAPRVAAHANPPVRHAPARQAVPPHRKPAPQQRKPPAV